MSSLEERREARRRRRQQEQEEDLNTSVLSTDLEERLAKRRREREERLKLIAAGVSTINGEDEFERRRRERREQRLRQEGQSYISSPFGGGCGTRSVTSLVTMTTSPPTHRSLLYDDRSGGGGEEEETRSSRRNRRRQEEEEDTDTSSYRSRRRRGGDEESSYSAPAEPQVDEEAERRRRQQEEEEEAERAEYLRQQQEEARRQREEAERQRQEAERQRREEEERQRRNKDIIEAQEPERYERAQQERKKHETRLKSDTNGDIGDSEPKRSDFQKSASNFHTEIDMRRISEDGKAGRLKSFFETKLDDTKQQKQPPMSPKREISLKSPVNGYSPLSPSTPNSVKSPSVDLNMDDNPLNQVQEQLVKFETSMHLHHTPKTDTKKQREFEIKMLTPGTDRLKDIQKKFQSNGNMVNGNSPRLGLFSVSDQHINERKESWRDGRTVLERWQHNIGDKKDNELAKQNLRSTSALSLNDNNSSEQVRRKSEKMSLLTAKFNSVDGSKGEITSPVSPRDGSSLRRTWSMSSDTSSDAADTAVTRLRGKNSTSNVTDRWQHNQSALDISRSRPQSSLSPDHDKENRFPTTVRRSNSFNLDRSYTARLEEEERLRLEQEEKEREEEQRMIDEEQRIEQEKLEAERLLREQREQEEQEREEEERQKLIQMEARRMAEEQKKKKKKGLGGLSPEKKKMLKGDNSDDGDDESVDYKEEKKRFLRKRVEPLPDLSCMSKAALQTLCKDLHKKLSVLEEDVYDWEVKIRKQDFEINELTLKVNDTKGKFVKPVLRKVNKTESKLDKIQRKEKDKSDFRDKLKSTGQNKFALEDEEKDEKHENWRENLKKSDEEDTEAAVAEAES